MNGNIKTKQRIYTMSFGRVYPLYITKAERKGRTKKDVDEIIKWLTGYSQKELDNIAKEEINFKSFFDNAPKLNPNREMIKGVVCGIRVEDIEDPIVQSVRYLDKLIDELAKGRIMNKILRS